jgi:hypothetical protein
MLLLRRRRELSESARLCEAVQDLQTFDESEMCVSSSLSYFCGLQWSVNFLNVAAALSP